MMPVRWLTSRLRTRCSACRSSCSAVFGRTEIIEHIYSQDFDRDPNTLEAFVRRLRLKLGSDSIETVRGQGYRMAHK